MNKHYQQMAAITLIVGTVGFAIGRLGSNRAPGDQVEWSTENPPGNRDRPSAPVRSRHPRAGRTGPEGARSDATDKSTPLVSGSRLEDRIADFFENNRSGDTPDLLDWAAILGSIAGCDRDDALRAIRKITEIVDPETGTVGALVMHETFTAYISITAWMRIGELEGEGAIEEFSSWWPEGGNSFQDVRMPFSALLSGWARTDSRSAREWMLEHLPGDRAGPDCTLDEAIQKIGEDALLKHLGLERAEPASPASPVYIAPVRSPLE